MSTLKEAVAAGRDLQEDTGNHTAPHGEKVKHPAEDTGARNESRAPGSFPHAHLHPMQCGVDTMSKPKTLAADVQQAKLKEDDMKGTPAHPPHGSQH